MKFSWMVSIAMVLTLPASMQSFAVGEEQRKEYDAMSSQLIRLTQAVHGTLEYIDFSSRVSTLDLLRLSTRRDQELLKTFAFYHVAVERRWGTVILLVCDGARKKAIMEDASCTPEIDVSHWKIPQPKPPLCSFTVDVNKVCKLP